MTRLRTLASVAALLVVVGLVVAAGPASAAREQPRVVLVTGSGACSEDNFLCPAFTRALRRTGVRGRVIAPDWREDPVASLSLLARQGYRTIFLDWVYTDVVGRVAARFPRVRFVLMDHPLDARSRRLRNVANAAIRTHEASYLAGWLAGKLEQRRPGRDVVGIVGGMPIPPVEDFVVGFRAGARRAAPGVTVLTGYSDDFADPRKCEAIARNQIARGAGTVFNVAGSCGIGVLDAARVGRVWGIGVDVDQSSLGRHILTSVVKHYDVAFATMLRQGERAEAAPGRRTVLGLGQGAAGLGRISSGVPAALRAELGALRRRIVSGEIRVPGVAP